MSVSGGGLDFKDPVFNGEHADIESSATEIENQHVSLSTNLNKICRYNTLPSNRRVKFSKLASNKLSFKPFQHTATSVSEIIWHAAFTVAFQQRLQNVLRMVYLPLHRPLVTFGKRRNMR